MAGTAKHGGSRGARGRSGPKKPASGGTDKRTAAGKKQPSPARANKRVAPASALDGNAATPPPAGPFRLGAVAGATPGKWIDTWHRRMPAIGLELVPLGADQQRSALIAAAVDAAIVRLPIDRDGLHVITLYDEVPVVVCGVESHLTAADELQLADLAGEVVITPRDDVLGTVVPDAAAPRFDAPETTEDAIATVAAGVGIVIVPMSLARLHHRKDVAHRPLIDGPTSTVALAWPVEHASAHVDTFIGIVRGRTANSSRD